MDRLSFLTSRKAQEEIVGFVVIVLLVVVIGVIFLVLSLDNPASIEKSKDISRLLDSVMEYSSECTHDNYNVNYRNVRDLLKSCYSEAGKKCSDGKEVCSVLNETLKGIFDDSLGIGEESKKKGYLFRAEFSLNATENGKEILRLGKGNCSSNSYIEGENFFAVNKGSITSILQVCY